MFFCFTTSPQSLKEGIMNPPFLTITHENPPQKVGFGKNVPVNGLTLLGNPANKLSSHSKRRQNATWQLLPRNAPKWKKTPFCQVSNFERCKKDQEGNFSHPFFIQNAWIIHLFQSLHSVSSNQALKHDSPYLQKQDISISVLACETVVHCCATAAKRQQ